MHDGGEEQGFLLEFRRVGRAVKVSAVDPRTGTEVLIVGDPRACRAALARAAAQKLRHVLERRAAPGPPTPGGRGRLV